MKKLLFQGVATALATPFTEDSVNYNEFEKFVELQIESGINALIVCGTTGEASTMTNDEKINLIKCAISVCNKRVPVIVGTGSNNTKIAIQNSRSAEKLGADGLLVVTPYYNKTTQLGLIEHFKSIANSVSIPLILYNVPSRTGMNILPETCLELSKIENIVGIKEAGGNISQIAKISSLCSNNLPIYSGNDDQIVPILSLGGKGIISVLSNINPSLVLNIVNSYFDGNIQKASKLQLDSISIINALFEETNPIPVKEALNLLGFDFGNPRLPLVKCSKTLSIKLEKLLHLNTL